MLVTLFGMVKEMSVFPSGYIIKVVLLLLYNTPLSVINIVLPESTFIAIRLVQDLKAFCLIIFTLSGIEILLRLVQQAKADLPMLLTLSGIVKLVRLAHLKKA
jgi:hypothetical protein